MPVPERLALGDWRVVRFVMVRFSPSAAA